MQNDPRSKKELTLIDSVVETSKEIIGIKSTLQSFKESLLKASRIKFRPIDLSSINSIIKEYEFKLEEAMIHCANLMKARYSKDMVVTGDKWHLSKTDMAAGFAWVRKNNEDCILFLSDNEYAFLDKIEAGEIHPYSEVKERLKECKPVFKSDSIRDLYLQKYREIED